MGSEEPATNAPRLDRFRAHARSGRRGATNGGNASAPTIVFDATDARTLAAASAVSSPAVSQGLRTTTLLALTAIFACAQVACGASQAAVGVEHVAETRRVKMATPRATELLVAGANDRLIGPMLARGELRNLVAWVESGEQGARHIRAVLTDPAGIPLAGSRELVSAAGDVTSLVTRSLAGGGFLVAWTTLADRGEHLRILTVSDTGVPTAPLEVAKTSDDMVWVEVVVTRRGVVLFWAEETRDETANVLAMALDARGAPRGVPSFIARNVLGWHAVAAGEGAVLGVLTGKRSAGRGASLDKLAQGGDGYALLLVGLSGEGAVVGPATEIVARGVQPDFTMVRAKGGLVAAWTDRTGVEPEVKARFVDERLRSVPVPALSSPAFGTKLLSLSPLARGALVAYEEAAPSRAGRASRRVMLARVTAQGAEAPTVVELEGTSVPELAAFGDGAALLGRVRVCERHESDEACAAAPFAAGAIELDGQLRVTRAERIEYGEPREPAQLAWNLSCGSSSTSAGCLALALGSALREAPEAGQRILSAPLFGVGGGIRRALVTPLHAPGRPRPRQATTLLRSDAVAQIATTRARGKLALAVLSRGGEAQGLAKSGAPGGAGALSTLHLLGVGAADAAPVLVSSRAAAAGGVSMTTAPDGAIVVAWAARDDGGAARIKLARYLADGKRGPELLVTTRRGDVSSVSVVAVAGGFVVGWVDNRDGQGEVYTAKVTEDLARVSEHQRITAAPGDAGDLAMLSHPSGVVWLAWSDPRESPREGKGDVYVATVRAKDARKVGEEAKVLATAAHSRSPSLAVAGDGAALAWIEEAPIGSDVDGQAAYGAMLATLDARLHVTRDALRLRGAGAGAPVGVLLDPLRGGTSGLLLRSTAGELALDAFTTETAGRVVTSWILSPLGPPTLDLPLAIDDVDLVFAEEGRGATEHRVRHVTLDWGR